MRAMSNVLPFPTPLQLTTLHAFDIVHGRGAVVAVFFKVATSRQHQRANQQQARDQRPEAPRALD